MDRLSACLFCFLCEIAKLLCYISIDNGLIFGGIVGIMILTKFSFGILAELFV